MTTFTDDQIKHRLDRASTAFTDKMGVRLTWGPMLYLMGKGWAMNAEYRISGEGSNIIVPAQDTALDALALFEEAIDHLPDPAELKRQEFMNDLAQLIEKGKEADIDLDFLNPLSDSMKRLSENALTYQPSRADVLQGMIDRRQKDIDRLNEQYGDGCRPAWVSADIAIAQSHIERCQREMAEIEGDDAD